MTFTSAISGIIVSVTSCGKQIISVLESMTEGFDTIKENIMSGMRSEIESTTWAIFDSMIWKKNTFGSIDINDAYEITVYSKDGTRMTGSLSATEQMALAYAYTLAIHRASGKNCPLVIDSPLGRVSDDNRENMAKVLKEISKDKQIIMLFTPDEYSSAVKRIYKDAATVRELKLQILVETSILLAITLLDNLLEKKRSRLDFFFFSGWLFCIFGNIPNTILLVRIIDAPLYAIPADHALGNIPFLSGLFRRNVVHFCCSFQLIFCVCFCELGTFQFARNF